MMNMVGRKTDIVTFSRHSWCQRSWKNRHQVVSRLTKWYRVLYVEEPLYIRHIFKTLEQRDLPRTGLETLTQDLARYQPPKYLPRNYGYPRVEWFVQRLRILHLRWIFRRLGIREPALMVWDPEFSYMLGHFGESVRCYFVDDQYSLFSGTNVDAAVREEEVLLNRVDLVFCTSEALCDDKKRFNQNVHLIPNGVDYELFSPAATNHYPACPELQQIPRPILGFVGNVDDRVDYELLIAVANDNPEWSIVLIGPDNIYTHKYRDEFYHLLACKNVKWLGFRSIQSVPAYVQGMDVCAIVNRASDFSRYVYPIKLHEYLAAGKPIVSTTVPSIIPFENVVHIADSPGEWRRCLRRALAEKGKEWIERRQAVARLHSWDDRAKQVHLLLDAALKKSRDETLMEAGSTIRSV